MVAADYHLKHLAHQGHAQGQGLGLGIAQGPGLGLGLGIAQGQGLRRGSQPSSLHPSSSSLSGFDHADIAAGIALPYSTLDPFSHPPLTHPTPDPLRHPIVYHIPLHHHHISFRTISTPLVSSIYISLSLIIDGDLFV